MNFREKLLLSLCYPPNDKEKNPDPRDNEIKYDNQCLSNYIRCFGSKFQEYIMGKAVLDFGFGNGMQAIGVVKMGALAATGIEIRERCRKVGERLIKEEGVSDRVFFKIGYSQEEIGSASFDIILSQDSFEHFDDPEVIIDEFYRILRPNGKAIIYFGPLWYSPYGGHLQFMLRYPWLHLLFSEKTIMKVRKLYKKDGARSFSEVEGGLNRMSVRRFKRLVKDSKFEVDYFKIYPVKNIPVMANIPYIGELFSSCIGTILIKN